MKNKAGIKLKNRELDCYGYLLVLLNSLIFNFFGNDKSEDAEIIEDLYDIAYPNY